MALLWQRCCDKGTDIENWRNCERIIGALAFASLASVFDQGNPSKGS